MRAPDTIYIGLQKAGTTFVRSYFSHHPEIEWRRRATMFQLDPFVSDRYLAEFRDEKNCECLVDMYEALAVGYHLGDAPAWDPAVALDPGQPLNESLMIPGLRDTAERIHATLPGARILITLRNQTGWLQSNYLHHMLVMPSKKRSFQDFLQTREGKLLLAAGAYDQLVTIYRELFGVDRVHVILLEDVIADEAAVLQSLCKFLGVEYIPFDHTARDSNTGIGSGVGVLVRAYSALGIPDETARRLRPWFSWLEQWADRWRTAPALSSEDKAMIQAFYAASNYHTSRLLNRDLRSLGYAC